MKAAIETFKDIPGYEDYQVSDYGSVRSLKYGKVKYLKPNKKRDGYNYINLWSGGKQKLFLVHRLVWEAFNTAIPEGMQIDHINTVRDDNRLSNLRVVTRKENMANPISIERIREANHRKSKDPKWIEANRKKNRQLAKDPKWIEAHRKGCKRRSKDPKWINAQREAARKALAKPILQLDKKTNEIIRRWECAMDAYRELGIDQRSISRCCNGKQNTAGGFRWCFA